LLKIRDPLAAHSPIQTASELTEKPSHRGTGGANLLTADAMNVAARTFREVREPGARSGAAAAAMQQSTLSA
jgi:hypothetical protein